MTYANQATADSRFEGRQRRPSIDKTRQTLRTWFASAIENWKARREEKRSIRHLRALSDHALRDIGIERSEIVSMVVHGRSGRRSHV